MVKLFVGNLPPSASNQSLKEIFQHYKDLQDYKLISNYGFVYLETEESAIHAVNNLNGLDYRGFPIAIDFAREHNQLKRKADLTIENRMPKPLLAQPQRFISPAPPQRNMNPYNLPFLNNTNSINRSFENLMEKRYAPMSYNNGFDHYREEFDPRSATAYPGNDFSQHPMVPYSQDIFNRPPISKRMKPDSFIEDDTYDFNFNSRYQPEFQSPDMYSPVRDQQLYISKNGNNREVKMSFTLDRDEEMFLSRREISRGSKKSLISSNMNILKQPNWYEMNRRNMNRQYLSDRDQQMYIPRRGNKRQIKKSYIDEYEDNNDYSSVDPYPAYLKQYQK